MIALDANILLYAYNIRAQEHAAARLWFEAQFDGSGLIGFSWQAVTAFIRLSTSPRIFGSPYSLSEAITRVNSWLEHPKSVLLVPTDRHWAILQGIATVGQASGPMFMDAHIAALAIEHGAVLATTDKDFTRFPGLKTVNPLVK